MISTVIFDLDNTLMNRKQAFRKYAEQWMDQFLVVDPEKREQTIREITKADRDGYRDKKELYNELLQSYVWKRTTTLEELLDYWSTQFCKCAVLMDGAIEVIEQLQHQGYKLGIITNGAVRSQNAKIDQLGLRKYFNDIVVSEAVEVKKPHHQIFEIALRRLGVSAKETVYIGDHSLNDVVGAEDVGMKAVWFKGFREWEVADRVPNYSVQSLRELPALISKLEK